MENFILETEEQRLALMLDYHQLTETTATQDRQFGDPIAEKLIRESTPSHAPGTDITLEECH